MQKHTLFVTGIDTEIGKTIISSILVQALKADYWKPVQAGDLDNSDTMKVQRLVSNSKTKFYPEGYRLNHPMSPHAAADLDGVSIKLTDFDLPKLYVPLNHEDCIIDLIKHLKIPVILVSQNYLGSINHTLLSINALKSMGIPVAGLIFNGKPNAATEAVIEKMGEVRILGKIEELDIIDKAAIRKAGERLDLTTL